ncbi:endonuclease [Spirosoma montaniterrae]|uniref:Endonuclease n=1 Tax=Spirosoma montaniterrae TaxID=1178516 RepID=A0A1P9X4C9_9BACT|nr:endonuclease [Spirosoma montaniterrae]
MRTRIGLFIGYFFRSLFWSFNLLLVLYTSLAYWLLQELPVEHWLAGMVMISLPLMWVINFVFVIFWLISRPWRGWLSGFILIIGIWLFGPRTFVWHKATEPSSQYKPIRVWSYNLQSFGLDNLEERRQSSPRIRRTMTFLLRQDAPIKCFQEFYNSTAIADYDLLQRLKRSGYSYSALLHPEYAREKEAPVGVAIFSIYPIVSSGSEPFYGVNGIVWANIKIGSDTIRVINVHLHSMGIRVGRVLRQEEIAGVKQETRGVLSALRTGFIQRKEQVRRVEHYIRESPYPVIVTGDFNDTPYSVVYERMRRTLPNSFEDAGRGFGFTYNRAPGFIRIDHQFHDPKLPALNFETINYIRYSDHYPIMGTYGVK